MLPSWFTSSIKIIEPTPEAAMQAQAMTLPPLYFTDNFVCFGSWADPFASFSHTFQSDGHCITLVEVNLGLISPQNLFQNLCGSSLYSFANCNLAFNSYYCICLVCILCCHLYIAALWTVDWETPGLWRLFVICDWLWCHRLMFWGHLISSTAVVFLGQPVWCLLLIMAAMYFIKLIECPLFTYSIIYLEELSLLFVLPLYTSTKVIVHWNSIIYILYRLPRILQVHMPASLTSDYNSVAKYRLSSYLCTINWGRTFVLHCLLSFSKNFFRLYVKKGDLFSTKHVYSDAYI